jgi:eukaryotic-like serine/threonine-protein kinase
VTVNEDDGDPSHLGDVFARAADADEAGARSLALAAVLRAVGDETVTLRIGRYTVLQRLGSGGMGVVYLAYDPELERRIALKLVNHPGVPHDQLAREGQALARLSHPNVVPVYDVGLHEGRVFLAMEHVEGETLAGWLRRGRPGLAAIVDVFIAAGRGLAAAHALGIVHRDFKPANVIVGSDGRVRVLDFGLAHEVDEEGPAAAAGTPAYMAPEQGQRGVVGPAADQYALCAALHEALWGELPALSETSPPPIHQPARRVPSSLARMVYRGLRKDPAARWPSLDALLVELARWRARPRRLGIALLSATGIALGVGLLVDVAPTVCAHGSLAGVWEADRQAAIDAAIRAVPVAHAAPTADRVGQRLVAYAERWNAAGATLCAEQAAPPRDPAVHSQRVACLQDRRGELQALLVELERAEAVTVERATAAVLALPDPGACVGERAPGATVPLPGDPAVARQVERQRRLVAEASAARLAGRLPAARELATAASSAAIALAYPPLVAEAHYRLGQAHADLGDFADAERWLTEAYWEALAAREDATAAEAASLLVFVVGDLLGRASEGEAWARSTDAILTRIGRPTELEIIYLNNAANLRFLAGTYGEAEAMLRRAEVLARPLSNAAPRLELIVLHSLANVLEARGDVEGARALYQRSLGLREQVFGPEHPSVGTALTSLGQSLLLTGELDTAEQHLRRALRLWSHTVSPAHGHLGSLHLGLGEVAAARGQVDAALTELQAARDDWEQTFGAADLRVAYIRERIAAVLLAHVDALERAHAEAIAALAAWEAEPSTDPGAHVAALATLSAVEHARGEHGVAVAHADEAVERAHATFGAGHAAVVAARTQRGRVRLAAGDLAGASADFTTALAPGSTDEVSALLPRLGLAEVALAEGSLAGAEHAALELRRDATALGRKHIAALALAVQAQVLWARGERCAALRRADEARAELTALGHTRDAALLSTWQRTHATAGCGEP